MSDQDRRMVCWPEEWIRAAVNAGFATYRPDGGAMFLNEKLRKMLQQFASDITEGDDEKEE